MQAGPQATQLFKFEQSGGAGSWERYSASVSWDFVNVNADSRSLAAKWQIEAGELETEVRQSDDTTIQPMHVHLDLAWLPRLAAVPWTPLLVHSVALPEPACHVRHAMPASGFIACILLTAPQSLGTQPLQVSDQFVCELAQQRCIIGTAAGDAWALRFPTAAACQAFADKYNACLFENTYEKPYTDAERAQVGLQSQAVLPVLEQPAIMPV